MTAKPIPTNIPHSSGVTINCNRYFTNDLVYELMCGIFDVESNHFDETSSLASKQYKYTRDDLLTYEGKARIADDKSSQI